MKLLNIKYNIKLKTQYSIFNLILLLVTDTEATEVVALLKYQEKSVFEYLSTILSSVAA